jgi:hypothetical protein
LETPIYWWDIISINCIVELPQAHGYDAIMVVVNSVTKCTHFILTHTSRLSMWKEWPDCTSERSGITMVSPEQFCQIKDPSSSQSSCMRYIDDSGSNL